MDISESSLLSAVVLAVKIWLIICVIIYSYINIRIVNRVIKYRHNKEWEYTAEWEIAGGFSIIESILTLLLTIASFNMQLGAVGIVRLPFIVLLNTVLPLAILLSFIHQEKIMK